MSDLRDAARQALEALEKYRHMMFVEAGCRFGDGDAAIDALKAALEQPEQRYVSLPDGLAKSDAEFWLSKRAEIIEACRAQGLTIVTTVHGVHLMRLGEIEAQTAALEQPEQEPVAWWIVSKTTDEEFVSVRPNDWSDINWEKHPLYTHPPQRKPLSDEELDRLWREPMSADWEHREYARAIEAAPKEKNHD